MVVDYQILSYFVHFEESIQAFWSFLQKWVSELQSESGGRGQGINYFCLGRKIVGKTGYC